MSLLSNLQKAIKANDFFHSVQFFRYNHESEYRTITGGFVSLVIIVVIIVGFATMILDTLNLASFTYTYKIQKQIDPTETELIADPDKNFMFGIQITNKFFYKFNLSSQVRYFDVLATHIRLLDGLPQSFEQIKLEACTKEHWKNMPDVYDRFEKLQAEKWLCPKIGQNISLQGKYVSSKGSLLSISASPCNNLTDPNRPCASPEEIDQFFTINQEIFMFRFYYTNTMVNPDQKKYLSKFLQDMAYITFSKKIGVQSYLGFSDYSISTDTSIWPFKNIMKDVGFFTDSSPRMFPFFRFANQSEYFTFFLTKSDSSYTYERQVQKISSVFSFIGGLIGAIVASLFIINSFTSYSYQISLASKVFSRADKKQQQCRKAEKFQLKSANIFQFLKYNFYNLCKIIKCNIRWQSIETLCQHRDEILQQLDVRLLIKRLIFVEFCIKHIFEDYELAQLKKSLPYKPAQLKKIRQDIEGENEETQEYNTQQKIESPILRQMITEDPLRKSINGNQINQSQSNMHSSIKDLNRERLKVETIQIQKESPFNTTIQIVGKQQMKVFENQNLSKLENSSKNGNMISKRILQTILMKKQIEAKGNIDTQFDKLVEGKLEIQIPVCLIGKSRRSL